MSILLKVKKKRIEFTIQELQHTLTLICDFFSRKNHILTFRNCIPVYLLRSIEDKDLRDNEVERRPDYPGQQQPLLLLNKRPRFLREGVKTRLNRGHIPVRKKKFVLDKMYKIFTWLEIVFCLNNFSLLYIFCGTPDLSAGSNKIYFFCHVH